MVGVPLPLQLHHHAHWWQDNKVADCLSHYYENDTSEDNHLENTYVNADIRLDPDGKLLPTDCYMELHAAATRQSKWLAEQQESRHIEAEILNAGDGQSPLSKNTSSIDDITAIAAGNDGKSLQTHVEEMMDLRAVIKNAYHKDTICVKIIVQSDAYPRFGIWEGLIWTKYQLKRDVICIPWDTFQRGRRLIKIIINHAHQTIGHCQGTTSRGAGLVGTESSESPGYYGLAEAKSWGNSTSGMTMRGQGEDVFFLSRGSGVHWSVVKFWTCWRGLNTLIWVLMKDKVTIVTIYQGLHVI